MRSSSAAAIWLRPALCTQTKSTEGVAGDAAAAIPQFYQRPRRGMAAGEPSVRGSGRLWLRVVAAGAPSGRSQAGIGVRPLAWATVEIGERETAIDERDDARAGSGGVDPPAPAIDLDDPSLYINRADLVDGLQRPRPEAGREPGDPAARADQVLRDLREQPGRVLHGPRRRPARPGRGLARRPGADGMSAAEQIDAVRIKVLEQRERAAALLRRRAAPGALALRDPGDLLRARRPPTIVASSTCSSASRCSRP